MKKGIEYPTSRIRVITDMEGQSLEEFLRLARANKEPVAANKANVGYSVRQEGVLPQYDIRTDKFAFAQDKAMELHAATYANMMKGDGYVKNENGQWVLPPEPQGEA